MRALIIGPEEQAAIAKVVAYAMEHFFYPDSSIVPGDNPAYVAHVPDGFRCVFTFTKHKEGDIFRHLTVSVPGNMFPSPEACIVLAKEFGFTASDEGFDLVARIEKDRWMAMPNEAERCIVMVQPVKEQ